VRSDVVGATVTFSFTGTGVSWIGARCEICGIAEVVIDGTLVAEVDTFAPTRPPASESMFSTSGLTSGGHTLVIRVTGRRNPSSGNWIIAVDAFDVTSAGAGTPSAVSVTTLNPPLTATRWEETDPPVTYTAGWTQGDRRRAWSAGTAAVSTAAGAQATLTFTGTSVHWIGFRGPQTGTARVFLDGAFVAEVDTFSTTEAVRAVVFTATDLAAGSHTLTIEVTGLKNSASTDAVIVVDAFDVTS
jgi:hypothetical protein